MPPPPWLEKRDRCPERECGLCEGKPTYSALLKGTHEFGQVVEMGMTLPDQILHETMSLS